MKTIHKKTMTGGKKYKKPSSEIQKLANVVKTYYCAHGHKKAYRNECEMNHMKQELKAKGIAFPDDDALLKIGIFNGDGAC